ncbi:MAG: hypothetical protein KBT34_09935 [Prevotella sp.]|nr:hypothetical protein [Candidatus Prevotella equi]
MKSGSTLMIVIASDIQNIEAVDEAIFTLKGNERLTKRFPSSSVGFSNGLFSIALTQEETLQLATENGHMIDIEAQVNFTDKSVAKTETANVFISGTLATELVDGNYPSAYTAAEIKMRFLDGVIVAQVDNEKVDEAVERADKAAEDATNAARETISATNAAKDATAKAKSATDNAKNATDNAKNATMIVEREIENARLAIDAVKAATEEAEEVIAETEKAIDNVEDAIIDAALATDRANNATISANNAASGANKAKTDAENAAAGAEKLDISGVYNSQGELVVTITRRNGKYTYVVKNGVDGQDYVITEADYEEIGRVVEESYIPHLNNTDRSVDALYELNVNQTYTKDRKVEHGASDIPTDAKFMSLMSVDGMAEQETTNGYQMLNVENKSITSYGITVDVEDGEFSVNGTANSLAIIQFPLIADIPSGTYTMYGFNSKSGDVSIRLLNSNGSAISGTDMPLNSANKKLTFTTAETARYIAIRVPSGSTVTNIVAKPMLSSRSDLTEWEKYTNGASPNPSYPQPIVGIERMDFSYVGKNLMDFYGSFTAISAKRLVGGDTVYGVPCKANKTYTASFDVTALPTSDYRIAFAVSKEASMQNGTRVIGAVSDAVVSVKTLGRASVSITPTADGYLYIRCIPTGFTLNNIQIAEGTDTDYEPYSGNAFSITPPRPLYSIGEYKDVCDVENGVWKWNFVTETYSASDSWSKEVINNHSNFYTAKKSIPSGTKANALCTHGLFHTTLREVGEVTVTVGSFNIIAFADASKSVSDFLAIIDNKPITVVAKNENTITEPISTEDLATLRTLSHLATDKILTVTDQNGRDCSYILEYIFGIDLAQKVDDNADKIESVDDKLTERIDSTDKKLDILWKLSQGQVYDFEQKTESGMSVAPSGAKYMSLEEVYGKADQETTNGYQLLSLKERHFTVSGIEIDIDNEGKLVAGGTPINATLVFIIGSYNGTTPIMEIPAGQYYFTRTARLQLYDTVLESRRAATGAITIGENEIVSGVYLLNPTDNNGTWQKDVSYPKTAYNLMLEKGTVEHTYEPYTGGLPMPNPSFPSDIHGVERLDFKVVGRNLLDHKNANVPSSGVTTFTDDSVVCKNNQGFAISGISFNLRSIENRKYTFTNLSSAACYVMLAGGDYSHLVAVGGKFTFDKTDVLTLQMGNIASGVTQTFKGMLEVGNGTSDEFTPYEEPTNIYSITPPRTMYAIGDVKDTLDVERGVWEWFFNDKQAKEIPNWQMGGSSRAYTRDTSVFRQGENDIPNVMCNVYSKTSRYSITSGDNKITTYPTSDSAGFMVRDKAHTNSLEEWNAFINSNDVLIVYQLAEPTTTPISEEDLTFLRSLSTLDASKHIIITDQRGEDVSYLLEYIIKLSEVN